MGHHTVGSPRPHARSVFDHRTASGKVRLNIFTECDTTSGHHHVHHEKGDEETASSASDPGPDSTYGQLISVAILEFGVVLHSILIGLTLAVNEDFIVLFVVLIFHRQSTPPSLSLCLCDLPNLQKPLRASGLALVSLFSRSRENTAGSLLLVPSYTVLLPRSVLP